MEEENKYLLKSEIEELAKEYALYLKMDVSDARQSLYNSIEEMLTKLDDFGGLVDTIRSDSNLCVDKTVGMIQEKCEEMKPIFAKIDQLESFVKVVRETVFAMEECVTRAEAEMSSFSSIKKVFSSLVSGKSTVSKPQKPVLPNIFVVANYCVKKTHNSDNSDSSGKQ